MEDARVVGGRCLESDRERLVHVVVLQVEQLRVRGVVVEHVGAPVDFGQVGGGAHGEPVRDFTRGEFHRTSFSEGFSFASYCRTTRPAAWGQRGYIAGKTQRLGPIIYNRAKTTERIRP